MDNQGSDRINMTKPKKRPSKAAKVAQKIVAESKLLAAKTSREAEAGQEFRPHDAAPKTSAAIKARPDKKRG